MDPLPDEKAVSAERMVQGEKAMFDEPMVHDDMDEDFGYDVEARPSRMKPKPKEPSLKERELHEAMGHIPYRTWCPACIAGHARSDAHRRDTTEADIFAFDYGYMERQADLVPEDDSASPLLIGRDSRSCWTCAELVPCKGAGHPWPLKQLEVLVGVVRFLGYPRLIVKTDGEPAILDLRAQLAAQARVRHGMEVTEETAEDSQANGLAEGRSTMCYNLGQVGRDGHTPWYRIKGKQFTKSLLPFAEVIMWNCGGASRYDGRWEHGIFLGVSDKNGQYLVGVEGKVILARTIGGRPWKLDPSGASIEAGVILGEIPSADLPPYEQGMAVRKRVYIRRDQELLEHGFTEGCLGCNAARLGLPPRPHTEGCRLRIEQAMAATEKGRQRLADAAARQVEIDGAGSSSVPKAASEAFGAVPASVAMDVNEGSRGDS
eukprot:2059882-Amphidinium_carterae.2